MQRQKGFTLIELLVVVSIIALLVAILVPTLEGARRQAKLVVCSSNLHQIGLGLMIYTTGWDNQFPPPCAFSSRTIYTEDYGAHQPPNGFDNRQNLIDMVGGNAKDFYFCPLYRDVRPEDSMQDTPYSDDFWIDTGTGHAIGYNVYFLFWDSWFDFTYSGNTGGDPPLPGDANSVVMSDWTAWFGYFPDWRRPAYSAHASTWAMKNDWPTSVPADFIDTNVLYADGHVETHVGPLQHYVTRINGSRYPY